MIEDNNLIIFYQNLAGHYEFMIGLNTQLCEVEKVAPDGTVL
jgi:hypothetical protein